ncbi:MAG: hypothetical protein ACRCX2_27170 [Paraclostridium sp.]
MNWYSFMINNLPPLYRTSDTLKRYKVIAEQFQFLDEFLNQLKICSVIDLANEESLMILGSNLNVVRDLNDSLETYRKLVKIEYYKMFIVPTHNNIKNIVKKVTEFTPYMMPLWKQSLELLENDHGYHLAYDVDLSYPQKVLDTLEKVIGAGIKVKRDYIYKMEGSTIYPAVYFFDNDIMSIECEVDSPSKNLDVKQNLIFTQIYPQIGGI